MKERYGDIKNEFRQILNKKNKPNDRRNRSFIEFDSKYIQQETEDNNLLSLTKNSFYKKEYNSEEEGAILNKKYNILKKTLDKLQIILENNIEKEKKETNDKIKKINNIKTYYINELINEKIFMKDGLDLLEPNYCR